MAKQSSKGKCLLCDSTFGKAAMTRHVAACLKKHAAPSGSNKKQAATEFLHVVVEGRYLPMYWLHLAVRADAALIELDGLLRGIWLECCGHMSAFTVGKQRYAEPPMDDDFGFGDLPKDKDMGAKVKKILSPGMKFTYEYDFGSTTDLALKVLSAWDGPKEKAPIRLLARNDPPHIPCSSCKEKEATQVCTECLYDGAGWFCNTCMAKHECGEEMALPVVNSPRVGVCAYTGN